MRNNFNRANLIGLAPYAIVIMICIFTVLSIPEHVLDSARLDNASFTRQMRAAYTLLEGKIGAQRLLWHWNTSASREEFTSGPIHLSYPSISYFANALMAKVLVDAKRYMEGVKILGCLLLCVYGSVFYQQLSTFYQEITRPQHQSQLISTTLGLAGSSFLVTNPSFLSFIIEPDFEDGLIFTMFIGILLLTNNCQRF